MNTRASLFIDIYSVVYGILFFAIITGFFNVAPLKTKNPSDVLALTLNLALLY